VIVENRTRWSTEDLASMLHVAREFVRMNGNMTWVNDKTVIGIFTYAAQKKENAFGMCRADGEGNLIEIKLLRPKRVRCGAVDALAGVVHGMPRPFLVKVAALIDKAVRGSGMFGGYGLTLTDPPWLTDDMTIGMAPKPGKHAPKFYAAKAKIEQKRLNQEHQQWLGVRAARQAKIDKLVERSCAAAK